MYIKLKQALIMTHDLSTQKIWWHQRNVLKNESLFSRQKSDVRQGATDRGSTSVANLVVVEPQRLQRLVLAAKKTRTHLDSAHNQSIRKNRVVP
jgi:hypothetical protein